MASYMHSSDTKSSFGYWFAAFIAGFLAVLIFHQIALSLLASLQITKAVPYSFKPVGPFNVPQFISAAFWGGIWGLVFYAFSRHWRDHSSYWLKALLFGMIFPTLVAWFVVAPLKGLPIAAGGKFHGMLTGLTVNGAWAAGTALLHKLSCHWLENYRPGHRIS